MSCINMETMCSGCILWYTGNIIMIIFLYFQLYRLSSHLISQGGGFHLGTDLLYREYKFLFSIKLNLNGIFLYFDLLC